MAAITAPDGHVWGYGRFGRTGGWPVLVHHGLIGDATLDPGWEAFGETAGIEWIVVERPGYGRTPPADMARLADWPAMIAPVIELLGIEGAFDTVGISAGAPYAYALAAAWPDRVRRVGVLSGVPFLHAPGVLDGYADEAQAAYAAYATESDAALKQTFADYCQEIARNLGDEKDLGKALDAVLAYGAAGPAREARLQAIDWGFEPPDVQCPVHLWHSKADAMVPFDAARVSAGQLPDAVLHVQEAPSHFASRESIEEMLRSLAPTPHDGRGTNTLSR